MSLGSFLLLLTVMQEGNCCTTKRESERSLFFIVSCRSEIARPLQFSRDQNIATRTARKSDTYMFFFPHNNGNNAATSRELNSLELHPVSISDDEM